MNTATALASGLSPLQGQSARVSRKDYLSRTPATTLVSSKIDSQIYDLFADGRPNAIQRKFGSSYIDWLEAGWDNDDAIPISTQTIANVNEFLIAAEDLVLQPEITPEGDGYIQLEWYRSPDCIFSLSFGPSNILSYSGIFGKGKAVYGFDEILEGVPRSIWAHIERVCNSFSIG